MSSTFGEMLLNRRRQMGLSIQQVANTIKIRPQIIEFFETGNFAAMPPRGYAQGMISSYARFLGLNPREVVQKYFDELYVFERTESTTAGSRFQEGATDPVPRSAGSRYLMVDSAPPSSRFAQRPPQAGYVSDTSSGHHPVRVRSEQRPAASQAPLASPDRRAPRTRGTATSGRPHRSTQRQTRSVPSRTNRGRVPQNAKQPFSSVAILLGVIAVLVLIVIILLVRSCSAPASANASGTNTVTTTTQKNSSDSDSTQSDTSSSSQQDDAQASGNAQSDAETATQQTQQPPTVTVSLDKGTTSWIEVKVDGQNVLTDTVVGPYSKDFTPAQSIEITVDHPNDVSVLKNGEKVSWDSKTSGVGKVTITVPAASATTQNDQTASNATQSDQSTQTQQSSTDSQE